MKSGVPECRKLGSANFWTPAYVKVAPRNALRIRRGQDWPAQLSTTACRPRRREPCGRWGNGLARSPDCVRPGGAVRLVATEAEYPPVGLEPGMEKFGSWFESPAPPAEGREHRSRAVAPGRGRAPVRPPVGPK